MVAARDPPAQALKAALTCMLALRVLVLQVPTAAAASPRSHRKPEYRPSTSQEPTPEPKPSRRVQGVQEAL